MSCQYLSFNVHLRKHSAYQYRRSIKVSAHRLNAYAIAQANSKFVRLVKLQCQTRLHTVYVALSKSLPEC